MPTSVEKSLKIFISYSRRDAGAADDIDSALSARGFEVTIDRRALPFGEEWKKELADFIRLSDTVIWLVSEHSIRSEWVNWELDEVAKRNKRLVPLMIGHTPPDQLPRQIGEIHILPPDRTFDVSCDINTLIEVLETDRTWLKEASRLQDRAHEWLAKGRTGALLLSRGALSDAERWKDRRPPKAPAPAPEVLDLLLASRQAANRWQRKIVIGSLALMLGALALAGFAYLQREAAVQQERIAHEQRQIAEASERQAKAALAAEREARAAEAARLREIEEIAQLADKYPNFRIPTFGSYDGKHTAWIELSMPQEAQEFEYSAIVYHGHTVLASDYIAIPFLAKGSFTPLNRGIVLRGNRVRVKVCATYYDVVSDIYIRYHREFLEDERVPPSVGTSHGMMQPALPTSQPEIATSAVRQSCAAMIELAGISTNQFKLPEWRSQPPLSRQTQSSAADRAKALLAPASRDASVSDPNRGVAGRAKALFAGSVNLSFSVWKSQGDRAHALISIVSSTDAEDVTYAIRAVDESGSEKKWEGALANLAGL